MKYTIYNKLEDMQPMTFLNHKKLTFRDGKLSTQDVPMNKFRSWNFRKRR